MKSKIAPIITLFLITLLSGFLITLVYSLTDDIRAQNLDNRILAEVKLVFPETENIERIAISDHELITEKIIARDRINREIGVLYQAGDTNAFGEIIILVAIKDDYVVSVRFIVLNQTHANRVRENANQIYRDIHFDNVPEVDLISGSTISTQLIRDLVQAAIDFHREIAHDE
ncbi:MAG: FMN-binding protein [Erysipelotrichales bacterium]|nr:FMN-binding protein [Erysipelotrichales bacterium]